MKITTYTQILEYVRGVEWAAFIFPSPKSVLKVYLDKEADANYCSDGVGVALVPRGKRPFQRLPRYRDLSGGQWLLGHQKRIGGSFPSPASAGFDREGAGCCRVNLGFRAIRLFAHLFTGIDRPSLPWVRQYTYNGSAIPTGPEFTARWVPLAFQSAVETHCTQICCGTPVCACTVCLGPRCLRHPPRPLPGGSGPFRWFF